MAKWTQPNPTFYIDTNSYLSNGEEASYEARTTALILSYLPKFYKTVEDIRKSIGLITENLYKYSNHPTLKDITDFFNILTERQLYDVAPALVKLKASYYLSDNWTIPLLILILTNSLPVPNDESIILYSPERSSLSQAIFELEKNNKALPKSIPYIYPVYKVSIRELKTFIDDNSDEILNAMKNLPKRPGVGRTNSLTLLMGRWVMYLKNEYADFTYADIAKYINDKTESIDDFKTVDQVEVRNSYESFIKYLKKYA